MASKRRAEAVWIEAKSYWQVKVQKDGVRKAFTSALKGRKGKHSAESKADEWLEKGTQDMRFPAAWELFLADQKDRTGTSNYSKHECYGRCHILPNIGDRRLAAITPVLWQSCIDSAAKKDCPAEAASISAHPSAHLSNMRSVPAGISSALRMAI